METEKGYNGWSNYETWAVALWIGNEQCSSEQAEEMARAAWRSSAEGESAYARFTGREIFTREERAVLDLEKSLKAWVEEDAPDLGSSLYSDLLTAAMSEVDWHEIAMHYVSDVGKVA